VSNALSLKHAIEMIAGRANLIQRNWNADRGCMMAVDADPADLNALLAEFQEVSIACYNGPRSFTLAGTECAIDLTLMEVTKADTKFSGVRVRKLHVTNAFHCHLVDPLLKDLQQLGRKLSFKAPDFPLEKATERDSTDKHDEKFLAHHLRDPVYFHQAVQRLVKKHPSAIWLEIGSSSTVTTMASRALEHSDASVNHFQAVNITSDGSFNLFTETTSRLWKEGLRVHFWAHHQTQTSSYTPVILPPYQFEKSKHWMDSKTAKPGLNLLDNQNSQQGKGLTTFVGYTDESNRSALFDVNTSTERFTHLVAGHIMAGAAAVCPGIFQMELVLDALMSLRPEFAELSFRPELQGMHHFHPLVPDNTKRVWIEAKSRDPQRLVWDWRILATNAVSSASREHTSGVFSFWDANDSRIQAELEGYERWISSKRCTRLLERRDADDILQGRNVYRAFSQIIDYKEIYRHVNVIVGKDNESAGRVVKNHIRESWLDSILTDCFCQVAGIFVNLMTERSDITKEGIFVCDGIGRWLRSSKMGPDVQLDHWEIFALHHPVSEKKFLSDVFVFNPHNGSLLEVILGISYQWTTADGIRKALCHPDLTGPVHHFFPTKPPTNHNGIFPQALNSAEIEVSKSREKTEREPTIINKQRKMDVASKTREIICNISGLGHDEVKDNSDLIELGIDSLMSMELTREVDATFRCSLEIAQLMDLTDFQSLVTCIQKTLGVNCQTLDNVSETHNTPEEESKGEAVIYESSVRLGSIVQDNALAASIVLEAFRKAADSTDDFIIKGHLDTYHAKIMPRSTELCVVYILDAFEKLGVNLRTAVPGQKIERVPYLHKHAQLMDLVYELLSKNARLIELHNGVMTRTAVATPNKPADVMLEHLLRDEPSHAAEHKLIRLTGERFAECITGKTDGLQIIFGTPEGRQIATDLYAKSPINGIWIDQAEYFLENLVSMLPQGIEPLCILEMGAGTGGTTIKMVQLFARLGIPVKYTVTDLSSSLVAAARKRFKQYNFLEFKVLDIEATPDPSLLHSQHIILATNCVHATRNLSLSTSNIRNILRPDGFLLLIEMTEQVPWVDFIFGLVEGWWLFNDGREHALQPPTHWAKVLCSVGFNSISWTQGKRPEANIQRLIIALADGSRYDIMPNSVFPATRTALTNNAVAQNRQMIIDAYVCEYSKDFLPSPRESSSYRAQKLNKKHCVLVTGTTGSLGSHVVEFLAQIPEVETVVCLNRSSATNVALRQQQSFELRGIFLDTTSLSKLRMLETDASRPMLGLPEHTFQHLVDNVTHIVHNAWPMSLTRQISAYEPQFQVLKNLILLSNMATSQRLVPFKFSFQFISSIGVVGYHPLWTSKTAAPEEPMSVESVLPVGYADAKLVCERILGETLYRYPEHFRSTSVRIAQISGSKSNGYWNSVEHFASLLRSSQTLNILPDLTGTLSWCPVQDVAATLGELLILNKNRPYQIYHIENPSRQRWSEMIRKLADTIGIPHYCIIPFDEWISRVSNSSSRACDNPARQLVGFFEKHFIRMSCGGLVLDTVNTWEHSKSFRSIKPVDKELVTKYIASWKTLGFLC
jgi:thioester reductase-like protein/acyl carrier protein/SAM-dependent methyltransferase